MARMRDIEWSDCLIEPRPDQELEDRFRRETGRPPASIRYFSGNPWVADTMVRLSAQIETRVYMDAELADLVGLVVSQDNSCRYCFGATRAFLRILGMPERRIVRLEQDLMAGELGARERAALAFARLVSRSNPLPSDVDTKALRDAGLSDAEIVELAATTALHLFFNRVATLPAMPPYGVEKFPDRLWIRLTRPLVAFQLRNVRRRGQPATLGPDEAKGPFAHVVEALDGLPLARELRRILDGMWESKVLSRRAKLLMFAVIARALGCHASENEAVGLLLAEDLDAAEVAEILAHLSSSALDPVESLVVSVARDTVWYEPVRIQRRAREMLDVMSREQFLEFVVAASLANAMCRLGVIALLRA